MEGYIVEIFFMKKYVLIFFIAIVGSNVFAQQILPLSAPKYKIATNPQIEQIRSDIMFSRDSLNFEIRKNRKPNGTRDFINAKALQDKIEMYDSTLARLDTLNLDTMAKRFTDGPNVMFNAVGGLSNLETNANGNASVSAVLRLSRKYKVKNGKLDPWFAYIAFNTKTHSAGDSADLDKAILFPQISKRDFVLGLYKERIDPVNNWNYKLICEFSLNRYKYPIDSANEGTFYTESFLAGIKVSKYGIFHTSTDTTSLTSGFEFFAYASFINIQSKDWKAYSDALHSNSLAATWDCIGMQVLLQISSVMLFCDMKYIMNNDNVGRPNNLRGFNYTIGTMVGVDFLKFRI